MFPTAPFETIRPATPAHEVFDRYDGRRKNALAVLRGCKILLVPLFLLAAVSAGRAAELKGSITNAQGGEALGKIQVVIVGTSFAAATGPDGNFQIPQVPPGNYTLQVSGVGFRTFSVPFQITTAYETKEFLLTLAPDNFRRTDVVEVHGDIFNAEDWPVVGDLTLTSTELQQTATVLANDPFRSIQTLPGVSPAANNDFFAQFSVMGAPYEQVGIYVDDVLVPNLLHSIAGIQNAPTLSLLTGNDVEDVRLMPVAFPVRYADGLGAALAIRTRTGSDGAPVVHGSIGSADSEILAEGGFGGAHKGTWLIDARKSYFGYLERNLGGSRFSQDGFYDANLKVTYDLTPTQTVSLYASGGQTRINDPNLQPSMDPSVINSLRTGTNDLAIGRLGWRWTPAKNLVLDTRLAYVRTAFHELNSNAQVLDSTLDREWSGGADVSLNWRTGQLLQAGYSVRNPHISTLDQTFIPSQPTVSNSSRFCDVRQDAYLQHASQLWKNRFRISGGIRWAAVSTVRQQPITGQFSIAYQAARNTQIEAAWGSYAQFPFEGNTSPGFPINGVPLSLGSLPATSSQYIVAVEQRLGERSRFRVEAFDRQNEQRFDFLNFPSLTFFKANALFSRDYSRGLQFILQRRSENRLSGWIGYTLVYAQSREYQDNLPLPVGPVNFNTPYAPTLQDQRHTANIFASYRLSPSLRFSVKAFYGSGFPVNDFQPILRIGPYERLDPRVDKSWLFRKWKLSLYGEILNATNHNNRTLAELGFNSTTGQPFLLTFDGIPVTPSAGLIFDF